METSIFKSRTRQAGHIQTSGRQFSYNNSMPTDLSASSVQYESKYDQLFSVKSAKPKNSEETKAMHVEVYTKEDNKNYFSKSFENHSKKDNDSEKETDDDSDIEKEDHNSKIEVYPISSKEIYQESKETMQESKYFDLISKDMIEFVKAAPQTDELVKCKVFVKKSVFKEYHFCLEYPNGSKLLLMQASRNKTNLCIFYWIDVCYYTNPATFFRFGRLSSNLSRKSFILIGDMIHNAHEIEETSVEYEASTKKYFDLEFTNRLIGKPKPKDLNVEILLPSVLNQSTDCSTNSMVEKLFKKSISKRMNLTTKRPIYDEASKKYKLDFKGRALMASSNNLQMLDSSGDVVFQLGKYKKKCYNCDFKHPISAFQAFSIAVSCLSRK